MTSWAMHPRRRESTLIAAMSLGWNDGDARSSSARKEKGSTAVLVLRTALPSVVQRCVVQRQRRSPETEPIPYPSYMYVSCTYVHTRITHRRAHGYLISHLSPLPLKTPRAWGKKRRGRRGSSSSRDGHALSSAGRARSSSTPSSTGDGSTEER